MKSISGICLLLMAMMSCNTPEEQASQDGIQWRLLSIGDAMEAAIAEEKYVFIDAYADWCGPCKKMEKEVFSRDDVGVYMNDHFVNVKLDTETDTGHYYSAKWKIGMIPTYFILHNDSIVARKSGAITQQQFMDWIKSAVPIPAASI